VADFTSVTYHQTIGGLLAQVLGGTYPELYSGDPAGFTFAMTSWSGFLATTQEFPSDSGSNIKINVCLGAPVNEPIGARAALSSGAAAVGFAASQPSNSPNSWSLAYADGLFTYGAQVFADIIDHMTTGSAEAPTKKFISVGTTGLWSWTYIIPVATDSEWLIAAYQISLGNYQFDINAGRSGPTIGFPAQSNQIQLPQGITAATLSPLVQAVNDLAHKTTVVSLADQGPRFVVESSEVIT
jgi:hypothetical protein